MSLSRKALQEIVNAVKQGTPKIGETWTHIKTNNSYHIVNFSLKASDATPDIVYTRDDNKDKTRVYWTRDINDFKEKFKQHPHVICDFSKFCKLNYRENL